MKEHEKMQRLLRLLLLLAGPKGYSLRELMDRFDISDRTVYRYINTIEAVGFCCERKDGTYRLLTNSDPVKSLGKLFHFSEEEAYILCQVLNQIEGSTAVKDRLIHKLHALYDLKALAEISGDRTLENIGELRKAISSKKKCC